jgi:hypothetical protein
MQESGQAAGGPKILFKGFGRVRRDQAYLLIRERLGARADEHEQEDENARMLTSPLRGAGSRGQVYAK